MAVPKKQTSKAKTRQRFANWLRKAKNLAKDAISKAKEILSQKSNFKYTNKDEKDDSP